MTSSAPPSAKIYGGKNHPMQAYKISLNYDRESLRALKSLKQTKNAKRLIGKCPNYPI
jgi:hypothetical protein